MCDANQVAQGERERVRERERERERERAYYEKSPTTENSSYL